MSASCLQHLTREGDTYSLLSTTKLSSTFKRSAIESQALPVSRFSSQNALFARAGVFPNPILQRSPSGLVCHPAFIAHHPKYRHSRIRENDGWSGNDGLGLSSICTLIYHHPYALDMLAQLAMVEFVEDRKVYN